MHEFLAGDIFSLKVEVWPLSEIYNIRVKIARKKEKFTAAQ